MTGITAYCCLQSKQGAPVCESVCVREKIHSSCWSDWAQLLTSGLRQRTSWHTSISPLQALLWFCIHVLQSVWSKASDYLQKQKSGDQFPCTPHETAWFVNWCHELLKKKRLILALDFSKSVCHAQARPLEFNDCFLGVGAHNAGGLQFEISDPDASFGLRRRKTDRGHRGATARDRKDWDICFRVTRGERRG